MQQPADPKFASLQRFLHCTDSYGDRELEKELVKESHALFSTKVQPSLHAARNLGNIYCGSVFAGILSILGASDPSSLANKRIGVFSYGSGLISMFFSLRIVGTTAAISAAVNLSKRLEQRTRIAAQDFEQLLADREQMYLARDWTPAATERRVGTYYLARVDERGRRLYVRGECVWMGGCVRVGVMGGKPAAA